MININCDLGEGKTQLDCDKETHFQITPSGLPIISSVDKQMIGGYPIYCKYNFQYIGQLKVHDTISFVLINCKQTSILFRQKQTWLTSILDGSDYCQLIFNSSGS